MKKQTVKVAQFAKEQIDNMNNIKGGIVGGYSSSYSMPSYTVSSLMSSVGYASLVTSVHQSASAKGCPCNCSCSSTTNDGCINGSGSQTGKGT